MSPEYISEKFGEYQHCKNLKFENLDEYPTENGELQESLIAFQCW